MLLVGSRYNEMVELFFELPQLLDTIVESKLMEGRHGCFSRGVHTGGCLVFMFLWTLSRWNDRENRDNTLYKIVETNRSLSIAVV